MDVFEFEMDAQAALRAARDIGRRQGAQTLEQLKQLARLEYRLDKLEAERKRNRQALAKLDPWQGDEYDGESIQNLLQVIGNGSQGERNRASRALLKRLNGDTEAFARLLRDAAGMPQAMIQKDRDYGCFEKSVEDPDRTPRLAGTRAIPMPPAGESVTLESLSDYLLLHIISDTSMPARIREAARKVLAARGVKA